ncbi:MAG: hypothetical protein WDW38_004873 [Sanguina aurantia]
MRQLQVSTAAVSDGTPDPVMVEMQSLMFRCLTAAREDCSMPAAAPIRRPSNIRNWMTQACSASVLEALVRGTHRPKALYALCDASAAISTVLAAAVRNPAALPACVSLAGTSHTLPQRLMQTLQPCRKDSPGRNTTEVQRLEAETRHHLVTHLECLRTSDTMLPDGVNIPETQAEPRPSTIDSAATRSCSPDNLRRQLRAIVTLSLARFDEFLVVVSGKHGVISRPAWLQELAEQDAELADSVGQMSDRRRPLEDRQVGVEAWEHYTLRHFHGRLLPGCCSARCTNLAGVSEAALQTWLCAGCRRVRYCSVECQKCAWVSDRGMGWSVERAAVPFRACASALRQQRR